MIILGIDPGTRRLGYGAVECTQGTARYLGAGLISPRAASVEAALFEAKRALQAVFKEFSPDLLAIEKLYFSKNRKTALAVAEARGVALLAAGEAGVPVEEVGPGEVKAGITGYGGADKRSVAKMVRLTLRYPDLAVIDDVSDALAIAIVAGARRHIPRS